MKRILGLITYHRHYWGVPHQRATDGCLIMTCYECGREQKVFAALDSVDERTKAAHGRVAA